MGSVAHDFPARVQPDGRIYRRSGKGDQDGWTDNPDYAHPDYFADGAPAPIPAAQRPAGATKPSPAVSAPMRGATDAEKHAADEARDTSGASPWERGEPDLLTAVARFEHNNHITPDLDCAICQQPTQENPVSATAINADFEIEPRTTEWMGYPLPPETPRAKSEYNGWGWYKLPHPDTGRPSAFPRATTIAKTLADREGLAKWNRRQVVGAVLDLAERSGCGQGGEIVGPPHLENTADGLLHALRDAYENATKVSQIDAVIELIDNCMGGAEAREFGECIHAWLEALAAGTVLLRDVPDLARPHVDAFMGVLARHGLIVMPQYVERVVINDQAEETVVGKIDCILKSVSTGELILGDIKTTMAESIQYGWLEWAVQVGGVYGWATKMLSIDGKSWEPMPEVAEDYAVVLSIPNDHPESSAAITINKEWSAYALIDSVKTRVTRKTAKVEVPKFALPSPTRESLRYVEARQALSAIASHGDGQAVYDTYQDVWDDDLTDFATTVAELL